jgi:hypothetical protein
MKNPVALIALAFALGFGLAFVVINRYEICPLGDTKSFYKVDTFNGRVWAGNSRTQREVFEDEKERVQQ